MANGCDIPETEVLELPSESEIQTALEKALKDEAGTIGNEAMGGLPQ